MKKQLFQRLIIANMNAAFDGFDLLVSEFEDLGLGVEFSHGFESKVSRCSVGKEESKQDNPPGKRRTWITRRKIGTWRQQQTTSYIL